MRIQSFILLLSLALIPQLLLAATPIESSNEEGYALGWQLGRIVRSNHPFINFAKVTSGMTDSLQGNPAQLGQERIDALVKELAKESSLGIDEQKKRRAPTKTSSQGPLPDDNALGYALGWKLGQTVKGKHPSLSLNATPSGLGDVLLGKSPPIPLERIETLLKALNKQNAISPEEQKKRAGQKRAALGERNEIEGSAFLAKNKLEKEITTTISGLQYAIIRPGNGGIPKKEDYVSFDYRGTFLDGQEFDSTYKRGRPHEGFVDKLIPGWKEALQLMPVGSKYRVFLPPELAFGDEGYGPIVAPKASLIYEIELIAIHEKPPQEQTSPVNSAFSQIDLTDPDKSAASFIKLYTAISPQYTKDDLQAICQTIAAESFLKSCAERLTKRLTSLQELKGLEKATFTNKKALPQDSDPKTLGVSWQEELTLANAQTITTQEDLLLQFKEIHSLWKIVKITQPPDKSPPAGQ